MIINNLEDLNNLAKDIAEKLKPNMYLLLDGDLGAGKTTFTKMLLKHLGVKETVTSPTFVILNQYHSDGICINHMDAYRLQNDSETEMYTEQFHNSINIIEWYNNLGVDYSKFECVILKFSIIDDSKREIELIAL